jgi:hypothetical protein
LFHSVPSPMDETMPPTFRADLLHGACWTMCQSSLETASQTHSEMCSIFLRHLLQSTQQPRLTITQLT